MSMIIHGKALKAAGSRREELICASKFYMTNVITYDIIKKMSLCEKRDISKYRLSQFFQEGNSENLTEEQKGEQFEYMYRLLLFVFER